MQLIYNSGINIFSSGIEETLTLVTLKIETIRDNKPFFIGTCTKPDTYYKELAELKKFSGMDFHIVGFVLNSMFAKNAEKELIKHYKKKKANILNKKPSTNIEDGIHCIYVIF